MAFWTSWLAYKIEELKTQAFNTNISVVGITETKLDNTVSNEELKMMAINYFDQTETKIVVGFLITSKIILLIIANQLFLKILKIFY